ncbi:pentatricopeptide repeat-containing protein At2g27610 [Brachypodium distachyon]|uniref:Pentatricopeptide repeat-containing protein n=1 Tax=Brachypodium distachyon TaxID=15368 RepID=I1GKZ0_BRADI|nr:pentatricopeptide repeat-containing protein At2g27610 [Brachypodium distachyon]XP_010235161.1 pentatricopeptide repeat-containing protein At2g27610 [Brachypodium distachyon]XP_024312386.1 pentatricopeptide repeat-containing protein At2g27610 [Brachypodium distachyon]KQK12164.2 hypothetical protein BRADI_1g01970v3 [Brachypodium distachyon]|eukprot:XP_010235135.1 pentatricopeptide repeat-containing protein At2g27610 [Brachypodium distachyon]
MAAMQAKLLPAPASHGRPRRRVEPPEVVHDCKRLDRLMKSGSLGDALDLFDRMPRKNIVAWTSAVSGLTRNGRPEAAMAAFADMVASGVAPNDFAFNAALAACADASALRAGEQVHSLAVRAGFAGDSWVGSSLVELYSRCGDLGAAKGVFDRMESPDVVGYTSLVSAFCRSGEFELAVDTLHQMLRQGVEPNEHTMASILGSCCPFVLGEQVHAYMIKAMGLHSQSMYASSALIDFYSRNSEFDMAKAVFNNLHCKNVVTWCSMMQLHIRDGRPEDALQVFDDMISEGVVEPNEFAFSIALGACGSIALGRQLHSSAIKRNLTSDLRVSNALLSMYGRICHVQELEAVLKDIENPDIVSWTTAISANFQNGFSEKAIALLSMLHSRGLMPNDYAFSSALSSCADLALLDQGRQFHCLALKLGCDLKICTGNALINLYSKCGQIAPAKLAFDVMDHRDVTSWNSLIHGYAQHGDASMALQVFGEMRSIRGTEPDESSFLGVLAACNHAGMVNEGVALFRAIASHSQHGATPSPSHYACVVDMMGRSGRFDDALRLVEEMPFRPGALIWKTLLASCRLHGNLETGELAAERLMELSEGGEDRDSASYVLMSGIHAMRGEWRDAYRVRRRMDEAGVRKEAGCSWVEVHNEVHTFVARDKSHPDSASIYQILWELFDAMQDTACDAEDAELFDLHMQI